MQGPEPHRPAPGDCPARRLTGPPWNGYICTSARERLNFCLRLIRLRQNPIWT